MHVKNSFQWEKIMIKVLFAENTIFHYFFSILNIYELSTKDYKVYVIALIICCDGLYIYTIKIGKSILYFWLEFSFYWIIIEYTNFKLLKNSVWDTSQLLYILIFNV